MPVTDRPRLQRRLPARPGSITPLRRAVVDYAARGGVSPRRREDVALAVSEALSNVVVHACGERDDPGEMRVEACIDDGALEVAVCHDGKGFAPPAGLGLAVMRQVTDGLRLERRGRARAMSVRMTFRLG